MASLCREPRPLRKEWDWAKCALYAARKEFELLKLLSTADEKVVAMAWTMSWLMLTFLENLLGKQRCFRNVFSRKTTGKTEVCREN